MRPDHRDTLTFWDGYHFFYITTIRFSVTENMFFARCCSERFDFLRTFCLVRERIVP